MSTARVSVGGELFAHAVGSFQGDRLVASYEMSASAQRVAAKPSSSQVPNAIQFYLCNYGIKLHECKDD
jgi:hypothetical protein